MAVIVRMVMRVMRRVRGEVGRRIGGLTALPKYPSARAAVIRARPAASGPEVASDYGHRDHTTDEAEEEEFHGGQGKGRRNHRALAIEKKAENGCRG